MSQPSRGAIRQGVIRRAAAAIKKQKKPKQPKRQPTGMRYPKRLKAVEGAKTWTGNAFKYVCSALDGTPGPGPTAATITSMQAYLKHSALIAPAVPRGLSSTPTVLYRGVRDSNRPPVGATISAGKPGCFAAFTYDREVAYKFSGPRGMVFRLQMDRIARGTPWIWYGAGKKNRAPRRRNTVPSMYADEKEVLLPPGNLKILRYSKASVFPSGHKGIVDVAYAPNPDYLRRSVRPMTNIVGNGALVYKTTGGHRLEMFPQAKSQSVVNKQRLLAAATEIAQRFRQAYAKNRTFNFLKMKYTDINKKYRVEVDDEFADEGEIIINPAAQNQNKGQWDRLQLKYTGIGPSGLPAFSATFTRPTEDGGNSINVWRTTL